MATLNNLNLIQCLGSSRWECSLGGGKAPAMTLFLVLVLLLWLPARGSQDGEEVEYVDFSSTAVVGGSVALNCGSVVPAIFIWGFTKSGTDNSMALVYNNGHESKMQSPVGHLGRMWVNKSTLVIEDLRPDAKGLYTCQAMFKGEDGTTIKFYSTRLDVD
ncbi:V-set and immunoglobulin domain-containing protein 10-like 2 [Synchiropus picturatus]